jgi:hypothetical protein
MNNQVRVTQGKVTKYMLPEKFNSSILVSTSRFFLKGYFIFPPSGLEHPNAIYLFMAVVKRAKLFFIQKSKNRKVKSFGYSISKGLLPLLQSH